ncbi:hypothetical protein ALC60_00319 [Trachymyrmex zeteki]|uniref:Transmembrane protein n=1 Tax=Mycetomoellerius zeteki TaxID=64791 RepID=A0A151XJW1_9HYME|nr:hypothetical protein ALC60_00319 [Trachymyrmex zeteki]
MTPFLSSSLSSSSSSSPATSSTIWPAPLLSSVLFRRFPPFLCRRVGGKPRCRRARTPSSSLLSPSQPTAFSSLHEFPPTFRDPSFSSSLLVQLVDSFSQSSLSLSGKLLLLSCFLYSASARISCSILRPYLSLSLFLFIFFSHTTPHSCIRNPRTFSLCHAFVFVNFLVLLHLSCSWQCFHHRFTQMHFVPIPLLFFDLFFPLFTLLRTHVEIRHYTTFIEDFVSVRIYSCVYMSSSFILLHEDMVYRSVKKNNACAMVLIG